MAGRLSNSARPAADAAREHDAPASGPVLEALRATGPIVELEVRAAADATELVLRERAGGEERRVALAVPAGGAATATLDLGAPSLRAWTGAWRVLVADGARAGQPLRAVPN